MIRPGIVGALLLLSACAPTVGSTGYDGRFWWTNIKSASDIAGGPRQDVLIIVDRDGHVVKTSTAAGEGTLQTTLSGLAPAIVNAAGHAGGSALVRPARNTTNVQMEVMGTGGSGGAGGSNTVTGTSTATSTGSSATAQ